MLTNSVTFMNSVSENMYVNKGGYGRNLVVNTRDVVEHNALAAEAVLLLTSTTNRRATLTYYQ